MANKPKTSKDVLVPRDHDEASMTEMMPFRSKKIDLKRSPLLIFAVITAIMASILYGLMDATNATSDIEVRRALFGKQVSLAVFFMLSAMLLIVFSYTRPRQPIWVFGIAFVAIATIAASQMPFFILAFPFRNIIPGIVEMGLTSPNFITRFFGMFFIAGLTEEWIKAIPNLVAFWLTWQVTQGKLADKGFVEQFRLRGPLGGVLMGMFAGGGFIMAETAFEYVPNQLEKMSQATGSWEAGVADALSLMLPRVIQGFAGHMGWQAIVGYGIGLAVLRPKSKWKLIFGGYLVASVLHGLWNSVGVISENLGYGVSVGSVILGFGCLLKARQLDAVMYGEIPETSGSIVVERPRAKPAAPGVNAAAPLPTAPAAMPSPQPATPPAATGAMALDIDGLQIPLRANGVIDLPAEPALGGRGAGVTGTVVPHPTRADVLGLRNTGTVGWTARLRDGSQQQIDRDQNIRLAPGVSIAFGDGLFGAVVAL